jgi:hypothetical protein
MKIEITDRKHWITVIDKKLQWIVDERAKEDKEFIECWRKQRWLPDRTGLPEYGEEYFDWNIGYKHYPCHDWYGTEATLKELRKALLSENTGRIYVDNDEFKALEACYETTKTT